MTRLPIVIQSSLVAAFVALAGSSSNYSTTFETLGATAGESFSATYLQRAEAGAESVATSAAGPYRIRHGFSGQLYHAVQIDLYNLDYADEGTDFAI